jgi:hypothetical protein
VLTKTRSKIKTKVETELTPEEVEAKLAKMKGIYTDEQLADLSARDKLVHIALIDDAIQTGQDITVDRKVTLPQIAREAHLTRRQKEALHLMYKYKKQILVAEKLGVTQPEVSRLLARAFHKINIMQSMRVDDPANSEYEHELDKYCTIYNPSPQGWRWFICELKYKQRLIYRKRVTRKKIRRSGGRRRKANRKSKSFDKTRVFEREM